MLDNGSNIPPPEHAMISKTHTENCVVLLHETQEDESEISA